MAPNKKKKKPSTNPIRGFATVSIASKPKITDLATGLEDDGSITPLTSTETNADPVEDTGPEEGPKELDQLSPDEFEKQLEESELQILIEKYASKCKRESARQVTRLQTERRVLRGQTERLHTRHWLPPEALEEIADLIRWEEVNGATRPDQEHTAKTGPLNEEESSVRLWTLQQALLALDISEDRVQQVLQTLLDQPSMHVLFSKGAGKDTIWGLEEALDWLALNCSEDELPAYENRKKVTLLKQSNAPESLSINSRAESLQNTPQPSGANTPLTEVSLSPEKHEVDSTPAELISPQAPHELESEGDLEPDELLPTWLSVKSSLYELNPDVATGESTKGRKSKGKKPKTVGNEKPQSPAVAKLVHKLAKIEKDVLFDQYDAERQWIGLKNSLAQDMAQRRRLRLDDRGPDSRAYDTEEHAGNQDAVFEPDHDNAMAVQNPRCEDNDDILGDFFESLPESNTDSKTGVTSMAVQDAGGNHVTIRDFGKWTGMSPRRILEDACRARDSGARIACKVISPSTFANRHSITITWSKEQDILPNSSLPSLSCRFDDRSVTITMISISTPDAAQSEAYISTASLFLLFASSPREEKAYLRLPSVWRDLWFEFVGIKKEQVDMADRETLSKFRDMVREKTARDEEDGVVLIDGFKKRNAIVKGINPITEARPSDSIGRESVDPGADVKAIWMHKVSTAAYQRMLTTRMHLPMWAFKDEVLKTIERQQVVIICGETGCGKSTQVPAFILENEMSHGRLCKIYCTEPRRISAISLARRVSEELGERKNDLGTTRSMIGYAIRLESQITSQTRLVYATTGIVMRLMESSDDLGFITHLVLDEVHERSIDSDFLLIILRKLMVRRPDLKVILMSATVDAGRFSTYLDGAPILTVPGRTFPVETEFLEDAVELTNYTLDHGRPQKDMDDIDDIEAEEHSDQNTKNTKTEAARILHTYGVNTRNTLAHIDEYRIDYNLILLLLERIAHDAKYTSYSKAILVFLPGIAEIRRLNDMLSGHPSFIQGWYIYPLHSTIASEEQERAFQVPPQGLRKIVLATNIAETGITIPDVTCVIDTGKHKEMRFDERRQLSKLIESFISRANAKQRRGRAGRVQKGICFHLFTRFRHDNQMAEQQTPEMLRLSLQDLVLRVKICKLGGIEQTLLDALDPPLSKNIRRAIDALVDVKALTAAEELTPLGRQLARLPLDVFLGKLVLLGSIFNCLDVTLTIAAILSSKSPFSAPMGARSQADLVRLAFKKGSVSLL
ncbi:MAG: hypothetical protein M1830_001344 [Pleopsidium flavum]|nr:MAG: hypothetical protein M1830_001344 [Pleopsidium flavum]